MQFKVLSVHLVPLENLLISKVRQLVQIVLQDTLLQQLGVVLAMHVLLVNIPQVASHLVLLVLLDIILLLVPEVVPHVR